jgi:rSAM/selenodomain-associated transferase 1
MKTALAIFVKTPSLTPVKTRLAKTIGKKKAETFYELSIKSITKTLKDNPSIKPYYAIAEEQALTHDMWSAFKTLHASGQCLGEVMQKTYNTLLESYDAVILIGSDSPQISNKHIHHALKELQNHDCVFGPAADGGFYLLAGKVHIPSAVWLDTIYSQSDTLHNLLKKLKPHASYTCIETLYDVDEKEDLSHILAEKPFNPNKEQQKLFDWINNNT